MSQPNWPSAVVTDASVWVSRLVPRDVHHAQSTTWLRNFAEAQGRLIAPVLLLAEVGGAISRRTGDARMGQRAVDLLLNTPEISIVSIDQSLGEAAAQLAVQQKLRGADAVYAALAWRLGIPLISLDNEHRIRLAAVVEVITL